MRERLCRWALAAVSLVLCALFALGLLAYTQPMEAQVYDLSFVWEGETPPEGWVFSDKGWTVFTQEGTEKRELVSNGVGGYTGLDFPGQTIYFSRVLAEPLDAPTLQIAAADSAIAVFLDDVPLYADFDREKAAIGALRLPTLDAYRTEPVTISLPMDYRGRTLTIAQGTYIYEGVPAAEITAYPAALAYAAAALLLAFLSSRAGKRRWALWVLTGLYTLSVSIYLVIELRGLELTSDLLIFLAVSLPILLGFCALLAALALGGLFWRKESRFYRLFCPIMLAGILLFVAGAALERPLPSLSGVTIHYLLWPMMAAALTAAVLSAVAEVLSGEVARQTEARALAERERMALASYESLLRQQQEILMLRHDMTKHRRVLQGMVTEPQAAAYLHSLTGEVAQTRTMANTGNQMIDILLNSRLAAAQDAGIAVELQLTQAPERLGLSDTELCSLLMNLLDNAVAGAQAPGVAKPYIKLDLHLKNGFFVFACENAAVREWMKREHKKESMQTHGLGRKIIQQIVTRHGGLLRTETGDDFYRVILALPISA